MINRLLCLMWGHEWLQKVGHKYVEREIYFYYKCKHCGARYE